MARKPRIHISGGLYHVMLRGNAGQDIFFSAADYSRMCFLIQEGVERFGHRLHAFCLMGNHIHLVIQVSDTPLSKIMQNLSFRYTRWINRKYERAGHVFQGRYKALLVDKDSYLLELVRYIHFNPVRAGLVENPANYEWSGHRAYIGKETMVWLTCDTVLSQFGSVLDVAQKQYANFVMDAVSEVYRPEFHQGADDSRLLGDDNFLDQVMKQTNETVIMKVSLDELLASVSIFFNVDQADLCSCNRKRSLTEARGVAAWLVSEMEQHTLVGLAKYMHRDPSALSFQLRKVRERMMKDAFFQEKMRKMKAELLQNNSITHA